MNSGTIQYTYGLRMTKKRFTLKSWKGKNNTIAMFLVFQAATQTLRLFPSLTKNEKKKIFT